MKKKIIIKIVISLVLATITVLYLISITTAPLDHTIPFPQMPWNGNKIYITYIIALTAIMYGSIPWMPMSLKYVFDPERLAI